MTKFISRFAKDESGATAIEYGLIAALVAVALITVLTTMSGKLSQSGRPQSGRSQSSRSTQAGRPLQVTGDLRNFWQNTYAEGKKEMK